MKLIDTTCPHCGSVLKINPTNKNANCEYCGATLLIDDEVQHIRYDNAEEAGYKFEKGRQRAVAEAKRSKESTSKQYHKQSNKSKTWLWVIGWIIVFPLPLTILLLRKKDMKSNLKYGIIGVAWIAYLIIAYSGSSRNSKNKSTEQPATSSVVESTQSDNKVTPEGNSLMVTEVEPVKENEENADDIVVNRFITEYNKAYDNDIHDISQGNIRTKYYGYVGNTRIEMINANKAAAEAFSVTIYGGQEETARDTMFSAFRDIVKILEPSITDDAISNSINELITEDTLTENYKLGDTLTISYVPIKEVSYGKTSCRIDILASDYKDSPTEKTAIIEPVELNDLQNLFASLTSDTSRDEINTFIKEYGLQKYAFTHDSAYYIGYESSAIRQRGRDREGEAVDINFVTSGDPSRVGMVSSAEYAVHTGSSTHCALKFKDGVFYYEGEACSSGEEAMQKFLATK